MFLLHCVGATDLVLFFQKCLHLEVLQIHLLFHFGNMDSLLHFFTLLLHVLGLGRDVRWSKSVGTGKERNAFPFKKDLSRSHFFSFFLFPRTGLSSLSYLSWD